MERTVLASLCLLSATCVAIASAQRQVLQQSDRNNDDRFVGTRQQQQFNQQLPGFGNEDTSSALQSSNKDGQQPRFKGVNTGPDRDRSRERDWDRDRDLGQGGQNFQNSDGSPSTRFRNRNEDLIGRGRTNLNNPSSDFERQRQQYIERYGVDPVAAGRGRFGPGSGAVGLDGKYLSAFDYPPSVIGHLGTEGDPIPEPFNEDNEYFEPQSIREERGPTNAVISERYGGPYYGDINAATSSSRPPLTTVVAALVLSTIATCLVSFPRLHL